MIPLRARRGANTVYFAGRVHGRRLEPGLYRLSLSTTRRPQPGAPATVVRVVSARRSVPVERPRLLASCASAKAFFDDGTRRVLVGEKRNPRPTATLAGIPTVPAEPSTQDGNAEPPEDDGLAGGLLPGPGASGGDSAGGGMESFAAIAVLLIVASLLFGMVALVTRFLRGSWNP